MIIGYHRICITNLVVIRQSIHLVNKDFKRYARIHFVCTGDCQKHFRQRFNIVVLIIRRVTYTDVLYLRINDKHERSDSTKDSVAVERSVKKVDLPRKVPNLIRETTNQYLHHLMVYKYVLGT
jgi:hypothetical protein